MSSHDSRSRLSRPPAVYGPRDKDIFEFFNTMSKGLQPMVGLGEKYVSLIHVADLVRGFVMAAESDKAAGADVLHLQQGGVRVEGGGRGDAKGAGEDGPCGSRFPEAGVYVIAAFAELFRPVQHQSPR